MSAVTDALDRLQNFYNDGAYDVVDNPGGLDNNGHQQNFLAALRDMATVISASALPTIAGQIAGLTLSNNVTDPTNDIDIATGEAASSGASPALMILSSALTKRLDATWAVGTGNGGLDAGSIANTTYHVWLIQRSDTDVVDVLFSTSATAPSMPTNYDRKRRIGSILRESGAIVLFSQNGDEFLRLAGKADLALVDPGTSAVLRTLSVPTGIVVYAEFIGGLKNSDVAVVAGCLFSEADRNSEAFAATGFSSLGRTVSAAAGMLWDFAHFTMRTNTSGQIRSIVSASATTTVTLYLVTMGWIDQRGKA